MDSDSENGADLSHAISRILNDVTEEELGIDVNHWVRNISSESTDHITNGKEKDLHIAGWIDYIFELLENLAVDYYFCYLYILY